MEPERDGEMLGDALMEIDIMCVTEGDFDGDGDRDCCDLEIDGTELVDDAIGVNDVLIDGDREDDGEFFVDETDVCHEYEADGVRGEPVCVGETEICDEIVLEELRWGDRDLELEGDLESVGDLELLLSRVGEVVDVCGCDMVS